MADFGHRRLVWPIGLMYLNLLDILGEVDSFFKPMVIPFTIVEDPGICLMM